MKICERLRVLREMSGLTLKEVGDVLGITIGTVQRYESGQVKVIPYENIQKLAEMYHVTPSFIMGWELTPAEFKSVEGLSSEDIELLHAYHASDQSLRFAIQLLLGIREI